MGTIRLAAEFRSVRHMTSGNRTKAADGESVFPVSQTGDRVVLNSAFKRDAPTRYSELRSRGAVHPVTFASGVDGWIVVGYEAAREALTHPALLKDATPAAATLEAVGFIANKKGIGAGSQMLEADPPDHTRLRRLVAGAFTPKRTGQLAPRIQQIADSLIDAMPPFGEMDLVTSFTAPLPVTVIAELLGISEELREDFRVWSSGALAVGRPEHGPAFAGLRRMLGELIESKRRDPQDDLLSALVAVHDEDDGHLSDEELIGTGILLVIAGHETTVNLLGNAVLAMLSNPEQMRLLREQPGLMSRAVEEFLLYDTSVEMTTYRYAAEDVEIAGTHILRGSVVAVSLSSANQDLSVGERGAANTLDVTRPSTRHLSFGHGIHHCLGAPLARLETSIALSTLLRRLPRIELAIPRAQINWIPVGMMRGALAIPVRYQRV
ncbi:cytochrome P450 family protein [Streptomyces chartreusis]|uniref:cytochrome P450 family protein n=1 Tax=Streptomyces chartreusis TaxID=1969 RepID=UPI0036B6EC45